jgi:LPS-assembly lipoprotein
LYRLVVILALSALLGGCGFQLRSATVLPTEMDKTYIATGSRHSLFYRALQSRLRENGVEVVDSSIDATSIFNVLADDTGQRVLSVSTSNIPQEFEVFYRVVYGVDSGEKTLMAAQEQVLTRDYTYDVTLVLGKAKEEELLREAIAEDLVRVILIQLSSLQDNGAR